MAKLYPPIISGTLPAFYEGTIKIPFSMNRAVSKSEIKGFEIKIKTVNGNIITSIRASLGNITEDNVLIVGLPNGYPGMFNIGQYYKVQLAYVSLDDTVGYFSSIGVIKYTNRPTVYIETLMNGQLNANVYNYIGVYSQEGRDSTEKLYSSRFYLYNNEGNIIKTSDDILHNVSEDVNSYESRTQFVLKDDLKLGDVYYLQYEATSVNGMVISSPKYKIGNMEYIPPEIQINLIAENNFSEGYVELKFENNGALLTGNIVLSRYDDKDNTWRELKRFSFLKSTPDGWTFKDYTTEQGVTYTYSIQQYNKYNFYSSRIKSNEVLCDFEDYFLCDQNHQLKVRFNPKVSTYKTNLLESKQETIGSRFPFFFRNGNTKYKELALSGLMSYQMDDIASFVERSVEEPIRNASPTIKIIDGYYYNGEFYKTLPRFNSLTYADSNGVTKKITTLVGDANLDGNINSADYSDISSMFGTKIKQDFKPNNLSNTIDQVKAYNIDVDKNLTVDKNDYEAVQNIAANMVPLAKELGGIYRDKIQNGYYKYTANGYVECDPPDQTFQKSTDLISENIFLERIFKNKVLDWLQDGKPKLFKSATEGVYIVRLMNVTAAPVDQLGRMLHSFNATAYEIDELTFDNLVYYQIIDVSFKQKIYLNQSTIELKKYYDKNRTGLVEVFANEINNSCYAVQLLDLLPGTIVYINNIPIAIGATGAYQYESETEPIYSIKMYVNENNPTFGLGTGSINCIVSSDEVLGFDLYKSIQMKDVPIYQQVGNVILKEIINNTEDRKGYKEYRQIEDSFDEITNIKISIAKKHYMKLQKRDVLDIYIDVEDISDVDSWINNYVGLNPDVDYKYETEWFYERDRGNQLIGNKRGRLDIFGREFFTSTNDQKLHETALYRIRGIKHKYRKGEYPYTFGVETSGYYVDAQGNLEFAPYIGYYLDGKSKRIFKETNDLFDFSVQLISDDIKKKHTFNLNETLTEVILGDEILDNIYSIKLNNGVILNMGYSEELNTYSVEETNILVKTAKQAYERTYNHYNDEGYVEKMAFYNELEQAIKYYNLINSITYAGEHNKNSFLKIYFDKKAEAETPEGNDINYKYYYQMTVSEAAKYVQRLRDKEYEEFKKSYQGGRINE